jgi:uncharacterized OsmC-like protein
MATTTSARHVAVHRTGPGVFTATNPRGGELVLGSAETDFSAIELLLTAIGACTAMDVDIFTTRRAEPDRFEVSVDAHKVRDETGNHLEDITVTFRVAFPEGPAGDKARSVFPDSVRRSHDRLCTVSRTVELGSPIETRID